MISAETAANVRRACELIRADIDSQIPALDHKRLSRSAVLTAFGMLGAQVDTLAMLLDKIVDELSES